MTGVVLDVATVRGAIGLINAGPRKDHGQLVDFDVVALGNLLEAICFADRVVVPDVGHIGGHEIVAHAGDAVEPISLTTDEQEALSSSAGNWLPENCDLADLVKLLGVQAGTRRGGSGSDQFLILQALGITSKYESALVGWMWTTENRFPPGSRADSGDGVPLAAVVGLQGAEWKTNLWRVDPEMRRFVANLIWTLLRTRCYLMWAHEEGLPYMPHPLRARMAGYAAVAQSDDPEAPAGWEGRRTLVSRYLDRLEHVHSEGLRAIVEVADSGMLRFPLPSILPYIVKKAGSRDHILEAAYDLRESRGARSLRQRVSSFEEQLGAGDLHAAIRLRDELEKVTLKLRRDLRLDDYAGVATTLVVGVPGLSLEFSGLSLRPPESVTQRAGRIVERLNRPWLVLLRDVFDALAGASSLGALYEVLYSSQGAG